MFFIPYAIQMSLLVREYLPRLKYGRKTMQGVAVVDRSSVDGAIITHGESRPRYFSCFASVNVYGDSVSLFQGQERPYPASLLVRISAFPTTPASK